MSIEINPTFGLSQTIEVPPPVPKEPPATSIQQVYNPNEPNIANGFITSIPADAVLTGTTGNIIDPSLQNAPVYSANSVDPNPNATPDNPNARLAKQSAEQKKTPSQEKDKTKEINQGGNKSHTITRKEIQELEKQTNLSLYPYLFGGELARIKHQFSNLNTNKYYLLLNMLVYGFDNKILQSGIYGQDKYVIDQGFLNDFIKMAKQPGLQEALKKTPAYQKKSFDDIGKLGVTQANANNMNTNPITGPQTEHPNLVTALINKIHPNAVAELDAFCNKVRTSAYLALPKKAFAAIQGLVAGINGVIAAFSTLINDIYNGIMEYVQKFYGYINGLLAKLQQLVMDFLESIIPVDILCILMAILRSIASDIPFFTSLMNMSNITNNLTGALESYVNSAFGGGSNWVGTAGSFASNPFGFVSKYLPPQVNQIINQVNALGNNPNNFLASMMANYGYGIAAKATQNKVVSEIQNIMGPNFSVFNPIINALGNTNPQNPESASKLGATTFKDGAEDIYGHPTDSSKIGVNVA
jgi:hypothetical protein